MQYYYCSINGAILKCQLIYPLPLPAGCGAMHGSYIPQYQKRMSIRRQFVKYINGRFLFSFAFTSVLSGKPVYLYLFMSSSGVIFALEAHVQRAPELLKLGHSISHGIYRGLLCLTLPNSSTVRD